jgi:hypothetical protein
MCRSKWGCFHVSAWSGEASTGREWLGGEARHGSGGGCGWEEVDLAGVWLEVREPLEFAQPRDTPGFGIYGIF